MGGDDAEWDFIFGGRARGRIEAFGTIIYNILIYGFVNHDFGLLLPRYSL